MLDVVIRGGEVVDGTGAARRKADVGIQGDRVVAIGTVEGEAATTIDATGKVVTPGFVDVHTHYDAQVFWDDAMTPSPLHGVTTAFAGNCGFTIAPLSDDPSDGEYLMKMLARVEGMPLESLRTGVPWSWKSTGEYLAAIDGHVGINIGFSVGHSAIRRVVMGTESTVREAKPEELEAMRALLRDGLEAGGLGFTSSYARTHNDPDGNMVPSRYASTEELVELARVCSEFEGTSLELIPMVGPAFEPWAVQLMTDMSAAAQRPINWNVMAVNAANLGDCEGKLDAGTFAAKHGARVVALTIPMSFPLRLSFRSGFVLDAMPSWESVMLLPLGEKLAVFRDPDQRRALNDAAQSDANPLKGLAQWERMRIFDVFAAENEQYRGKTVGEIAEAEGRDPWDVLTSIALADDLNTGFGTTPLPESADDWKARVQVWRDRRALIGASDAGAHLDMFSTANYATRFLGAVRDHSLMPLEEAVSLITQVPAELYGLRERGEVREGWKADLTVFDPARIDSDPVAMRYDLPGGAGRLFADAIGVRDVLVNGTPIVRDGALTSDRPGTVLRSGRDTTNGAMA